MSKLAKQLAYGKAAVGRVYKSGGPIKHDDEAQDKAMVKKMVKAEALTGKKMGGKVKPKKGC